MGNKHMQKCSKSHVIRKMQIKTARSKVPVLEAKIWNTDALSTGENEQQQEFSSIAGGNANPYEHFGKQFGGFL